MRFPIALSPLPTPTRDELAAFDRAVAKHRKRMLDGDAEPEPNLEPKKDRRPTPEDLGAAFHERKGRR